MKTTSIILILVSLLTVAPLWASEKLEISLGDNLPKLVLNKSHYTRNSPQNFYDQAMFHMTSIYPSHVMLCKRRIGRVGQVLYSLVCFKKTPEINEVTVDGEVVVPLEESWQFKINVKEENINDALLRILEAISKLPYNKSIKRD